MKRSRPWQSVGDVTRNFLDAFGPRFAGLSAKAAMAAVERKGFVGVAGSPVGLSISELSSTCPSGFGSFPKPQNATSPQIVSSECAFYVSTC